MVITHVITIGEVMLTLKLTAVGNSIGVVFPKEALDKLHLEKGDNNILIRFILFFYQAALD